MKNENTQSLKVVKMDHEKIRGIIDSIGDLPAIPSTFTRMREIIDDPKSSSKDLGIVIEKDQALTTKILKVANSAYYGFSRTISTVNDSIILMGFQKTWHVAMSISMMNLFKKDSRVFNREVFWEHSLKVGLCAQIIARMCRYPKPQELYTIGLLHDIGKLIFDQYFHNHFIAVVKKVKEEGVSFCQAEEELIGANHALIGSWLIDKWKLPQFFGEAILLHHADISEQVTRIAYIISLADNICLLRGIGLCYSNENIPNMNVKLIEKLKLSESHLKKIESTFDEAAKRITVTEESS